MRKLLNYLVKGDQEAIKDLMRENLELHVGLSEGSDKFQTLSIGLSIKGDPKVFSVIHTSIPRFDLECFKEDTDE